MEKTFIFLGLIVAIVIGGIIIFSGTVDTKINKEKNIYDTQTDSQAEVTVDVTPLNINSTGGNTVFEVALNTHTVDLDYDFVSVMTLQDNLGNIYRATEWTGDRGWHHLNGNIIFPQINLQATSITLMIAEVGGVDRSFEWSIK